MCLAVPGKVVKIKDDDVTLDYGPEQRSGKNILDDLKVGDYAIMQGKMIIQKIPKREAIQSLKLYQQVMQAD